MKKPFVSVSLFPFMKKLDRSSYGITMTDFDVIPIIIIIYLFIFA